MKASELLIRCLENEGVRFVFGLPGEETLDVMDAMLDSRLQFIATRHEQGAAFMADVHGRLTGKAGVCLSTLGPGATNLLTGIADANLDRAPLVAITGQASLDRMHKESHQYVDILTMFRPVTKWNAEVLAPRILPEVVRKAFKIAQTEKPGATHLELPEDVAADQVDGHEGPLQVQAPFTPEPPAGQVDRAVQVIGSAQKPVLLVGNGVIRGHASEAVRRFARGLGIPVTHTFMGKGIMPDSDPLSLYTIGLTLRDYASRVFDEADVIIAVGYDFVEFAPCFWNRTADKRIVHIDVSPAEVDVHYIVDVGVLGDVSVSLREIQTRLDPFDHRWARHCQDVVRHPLQDEIEQPASWPMRPQHLVRDLRASLSRPDDTVICDVGAHKLWMARLFPCETPNSCIISNGYAAMGIGLPGAIAAKLSYPERRIVAVTGDGGFLMNSQELETAVRLRLPLVVLVWRDDGYGVIRWKQMLKFNRGSAVEFGNPDFVSYAQSFGASGFRVSEPGELVSILTKALACGGPAVVECRVDYTENMRLSERLSR
jgi:acetolactate synthase I/II/III large subunit